jgi:thioredoxin 1
MAKPIDLTNETFAQEVLQSDIPVLVDFWAPWCAPCRMMAPVLEDLAKDMEGKLKVAKLDVENPNHQQLAMEYGIQSIPNMKLFKGGKVAKDFIGFRPKEMFLPELQAAL